MSSPKPRPKFLGPTESHPIEHGNETEEPTREDDLIGSTPHEPAPDLRADEPFGETTGAPEKG